MNKDMRRDLETVYYEAQFVPGMFQEKCVQRDSDRLEGLLEMEPEDMTVEQLKATFRIKKVWTPEKGEIWAVVLHRGLVTFHRKEFEDIGELYLIARHSEMFDDLIQILHLVLVAEEWRYLDV